MDEIWSIETIPYRSNMQTMTALRPYSATTDMRQKAQGAVMAANETCAPEVLRFEARPPTPIAHCVSWKYHCFVNNVMICASSCARLVLKCSDINLWVDGILKNFDRPAAHIDENQR
ncbi:hypothetical protein I3J27_33675 [Bradyrhizobium xenonodulans]|uniref:Uncharacterized protein n=1 Tax=Bradyrhizobium xenonodulans TaxID=2736875 RepID=A0ABY7MHI5_9BRAD|nr:hypothetical protein [Bradyrhizobium xenonodulans]WBL77880.1 hypothetical protein I3J27_33675 [Bradyrhizobium xenonodulans]